jgi:hypothetical protein
MNVKILLFAIIGGVLITLLTGLIPNTRLLGATHFGYPLTWLIRLAIAPQIFPWRINALYLVVDTIVWSIIIGITLFVLIKKMKNM